MARPPARSPPPTPVFYGTTPATGLVGEDRWAQRDPSTGWDAGDNPDQIVIGHLDAVAQRLAEALDGARTDLGADLKAEVAAQVSSAVLEYAQAIEFEIGLAGNEIIVAAVIGDGSAAVRSYVGLAEILDRAQSQASSDAKFLQALLGVLHGLIAKTARVGQPSASRSGTPQRKVAAPSAPIVRPNTVDNMDLPGAFDSFGSPMPRRT